MKKIIIFITFFLISQNISFAEDKNRFIIGKIKNEKSFFVGEKDKETDKFKIEAIQKHSGNNTFGTPFLIIKDNILLNKNLEKVEEIHGEVLKFLASYNRFRNLNTNDIIIFEYLERDYSDVLTNLDYHISSNYFGNNQNIFEHIYKVACYEDNFYTYNYDFYDYLYTGVIGFQEEQEYVADYYKNIGFEKEKIENKLKKLFEDCSDFNKFFKIEPTEILYYKYEKDYHNKKIDYIKKFKKYGKKLTEIRIKDEKSYYDTLENIRKNINQSNKYSQNQKNEKNIIIDAIQEF